MVKIYPVVGAVVTLTSLILLAIGASTNRWVTIDQSDKELNPIILNNEFDERLLSERLGVTIGNFQISYSMSQFGLWVGCHKEHKSAISCAYIGSSCVSNVCWIRIMTESRSTTCLKSRVKPIENCLAFQIIRSFTVIGLIFLLFGACSQWVSLLSAKRPLAMLAGIIIFIAACLIIVAVTVFQIHIWLAYGLSTISKRGYSFFLVVVSIPLAIIGSLVSCFAASMGLRHKEYSDYTASNY